MGKKKARFKKVSFKEIGPNKIKEEAKKGVEKHKKEVGKPFDWALMLLMFFVFIVILFLIFLFSRNLSICGDGRCDKNECNSCLKDCTFRNCADSSCQILIGENCKNSKDCACGAGEMCDISSERADSKGCFSSISNVFINVQDVAEGISASTLYFNPMLNDGVNNHLLMNILVQNIGESNISNIILNLKIQDFVSDVIVLGNLEKDEIKVFKWNPRFKEEILNVVNDTGLNVDIKLSYSEETGQEHTLSKDMVLNVLGRNKIGNYGSYENFVTSEKPAVKDITKDLIFNEYNTANDILIAATKAWDKMGKLGITLSSDNIGYVQFPEDTISSKKGDGEDIAVLYASILKNINIKPAIIKTSDKVFVGFYDNSGRIYPVDTKLVGKTFNYAWTIGFADYADYTRKHDIEVINV